MIEVLKEEINKSLKEIQENPNKKCEKWITTLKKSGKAQRSCGKKCIKLCTLWNFLQIDHIHGHKASFNRYEKLKIIPCIPSEFLRLLLDIKNNSNHRKFHNSGKLKKSLLNKKIGNDTKKEKTTF